MLIESPTHLASGIFIVFSVFLFIQGQQNHAAYFSCSFVTLKIIVSASDEAARSQPQFRPKLL
jgi:hypothetical protein